MYNKYTIEPVRYLTTKEGEELVEETDPHNADDFVLMGHYEAENGVDISEPIYAAATMDGCRYIYEQITGKPYETV